ncbi:isoamyl acetate-hydrolyzing esterase 1 homolog [Brachyhypopomus gauderio]|uniref:isoamyl acetate-hydrolyzing esterase 1 homolog n=1 Tax=Brachyhypopomus gauderio TaxID=698409 RepID=UPI004042B0BD
MATSSQQEAQMRDSKPSCGETARAFVQHAVCLIMSQIKSITWPRVVLFGDSITQFCFQTNGWGSEIANKLARKCDVVNRGLSGYNTRWAAAVLPRIITHSDPVVAAVVVFFGANDSSLEDKNPQQHVPCEEYKENLKGIVGYLASAGVPKDKVVFITPPPLHEACWEKECILKGSSLNRLNSVTGQYAQACVQAAGHCGVDVLDLWSLMQKDGEDFSEYLSDGLHLSEKGKQFVAEHLWTLLESRVADLPFILPHWADVDAKNPENSLLCD